MVDLYPAAEGVPGVEETDLNGFLMRCRQDVPPLIRLAMKGAAMVYALAPLFTVGVPLPSFLLPPRLRDKHASKMSECRFYQIRQLIGLLKWMAALCWGQDPKVRKALGLEAYSADPGTWRAS